MRNIFAAAVFTLLVTLASSTSSQQRQPLKLDREGEPYPETATSFDCKKATGRVERMICGDRALAMDDGALGEKFWFLRHNLTAAQLESVAQSQRTWIRHRNQCPDRQCVEHAYEKRTRKIEGMLDARLNFLRRNLNHVGQCEKTQVQWFGPRLQITEGNPPDGTSVALADGVSQVSYDRVAAILSSKIGDPVRVCLISLPHNCPPGDKRGRVYHVTNIRTRDHWELPDAEHACGGA